MEQKSKLTIIVDGNWLLMSRWAVLNGKYNDDTLMCKDLQKLLVRSMIKLLNDIPEIDNIIFVADGGSWRNTLDIPSCLDEEYKGNRVLNPDVNWDMIFEYYTEFTNILAEHNITVTREIGVEGDDWCWYWSTKLNKEGTNVIIWSMDKDLTQLVKTDSETGCFTVCWNKNAVTLEDVDYSNGSELDFFFSNLNKSTNQKCLHSIISRAKNVIKINPKHIVIDKIIRGDNGDNIFPIFVKNSTSNPEKKYRVAQKDLNDNLNIHNTDEIKSYINNLLTSKTYAGKVNKSFEDIFEHFNYNVKLVELQRDNYPQDILDIMETHNNYNVNKDLKTVSESIETKNNDVIDIINLI